MQAEDNDQKKGQVRKKKKRKKKRETKDELIKRKRMGVETISIDYCYINED